ncbi:hypothetical protein [Sphingorhabdus sp.]|uniref:hypothetical protein n=1 Tax=Sphingorhabdus sp. TaxID=1902408 RepID=UPI0039BD8995
MTVVSDIFLASRNAARARLAQFIPGAGQNYAFGRNTDPGPEQPSAVSKLSPYLRYRMITEQEVVQAVLEQHSLAAAEKFIQEILWRTAGGNGLSAQSRENVVCLNLDFYVAPAMGVGLGLFLAPLG